MKAKLLFLGLASICFSTVSLHAQELELTEMEELQQKTELLEDAIISLKKLKVSGYIQTQYQYDQKDASLKVGSANENMEDAFNRIGIRRGRIKFTYEEGIASGVFQLDITEKGVGFKDAYLNVKDPWVGTNALRAGVFDRPFGYEISYSSSRRESPERSTVFQTLFPDERDLGAMLILQPAKTSPLNFIKLEAGLFTGNGIKQETDNRKDFIGHFSLANPIGDNTKYGVGVSYYHGSVYQGDSSVYTMHDKRFVQNKSGDNLGSYAKRQYVGFDAQISHMSLVGLTQLRAEYLFGQQPGTASSSKSPNSSTLPDHATYIRNFTGGYVMLVQDLGLSPFSVVLKYDWYDPNIKVSKNEVGLNGTGKADALQTTVGVGALWRINNSLRLQAYYEFNDYQSSDNLASLDAIESNVFTMRLQYKF
ncbi:MAG: OprO/OprP family phosphate-selective porin [Tannerellaceae bacterium]|nr:OprO/OprP family phosphate-selective porin [Tannerellaceae bacterium]